jgi:hypothetical protein
MNLFSFHNIQCASLGALRQAQDDIMIAQDNIMIAQDDSLNARDAFTISPPPFSAVKNNAFIPLQ